MSKGKIIDLKKESEKIYEEKRKIVYKTMKDIGIDETLTALQNHNNFGSYYDYSDNGTLKFYPKILANNLLEKYDCINVTDNEFDTMIYLNGVYTPNNILRNDINKNIISKDTNPDKHRILTLKEVREQCLLKPNEINKNKNLINFKNGMYDITKDKLLDHDPKYFSTVQLNVEYNQKCKSIHDTLFGHLLRTSLTEETQILLQEIFGYCLTLRMDAQKFFILFGEGSNGKTQTLLVLNALFPENYTSSLELKHFQDDVRVFSIFNKFLNVCADISSEYISDDSILKRASGEDMIHCNPKYKAGFDFKCMAKVLFSCNELPSVSDKTFGFIRKLVIVKYSKEIKEVDKIKSIAQKIISDKDAMNAVAFWAIKGLKRLIKNNWTFSEGKETKTVKRDYEFNNNSVKKFINEFCIIKAEKSFIPVTEFKTMYKKWCSIEDIKPLGNKNLESTLEAISNKKKNTLYKGWYYENICWSNEINEIRGNESLNGIVKIKEDNEFFKDLPHRKE